MDSIPDLSDTILLVEDDDSHALLMERALSRVPTSCRLLRCVEPEELLRFVEQEPGANRLPAMVVLDLGLPRIDGMTLLERLRASSAWRGIPVVIFTIAADEDEIFRCQELGANSVVIKPADARAFEAAFNSLATYWLNVHARPYALRL